MLTPGEILGSLQKAQQDLMEGTFSTPPSTWEEFQRRLGMYQANETTINDIRRALRQNEDN